jgi:transcription-repair coupling factor (superfamily II helicase)
VPDVHLRLVLYKRIASTLTREELDGLRAEMIDRFGPMPQYAKSLFRIAQIKLRAGELGIRKIDAGPKSGYIVFEERNRIDSGRVLKLVQGKPKDYRLDGPLKLRFNHDAGSEELLFTRIELLVELLA